MNLIQISLPCIFMGDAIQYTLHSAILPCSSSPDVPFVWGYSGLHAHVLLLSRPYVPSTQLCPLTPKLPRPPDLRTGCSLCLKRPSSRGPCGPVSTLPLGLELNIAFSGKHSLDAPSGLQPYPTSTKLVPLSTLNIPVPPGRSVPF